MNYADGAKKMQQHSVISKLLKKKWKQMLEDDFVCHQQGNAIFI